MCNEHAGSTDTGTTHEHTKRSSTGRDGCATSVLTNTLDSRALGLGDAFGQRLMRTGTYHYDVVPAGTSAMRDDRPFSIVVEDDDGSAMAQHDVVLRHDGSRFVAEPDVLVVREGDLVMWGCADPRAPRFEVVGDKEFFSSGRMTNECGYSHAFGLPGEYEWADAFGSDVHGVVRVKEVRCETAADLAKWREQLSTGTLVMIHDGKVDPAEVEVVTGQTVFFAVVTGPGISVTDRALLGTGGPRR